MCTPCATVGVSCTGEHLVQPGTQPSCQPRREYHVLDSPPPHPKSAGGLAKSRAPPPNSLCLPLLQPALSVSGLSWSWLSAWVWVWVLVLFFPHLPPPSFPSIIALFNRSRPPTLPAFLFRASLFSSRRLPVIVLRIRLPFQTNLPPPLHPLPGSLEQTLLFTPCKSSYHVFKKRPRLRHAVERLEPPE